MYDRQTESWWQQFSGLGIVGDFAGTRLKQISADIIAYEDFRSAYSEGKVLSYKTGYIRPYGRNPYVGYDSIDDIPYLFDGSTDERLSAMERVINDEIEGLPVIIFSKQGTLSVLDASDIEKSRLIPSATA